MKNFETKITIFSDLHAHDYKKFDKNGSRLRNTMKVVEDIFEYNDKHGIDTTLFAGDWYDSQKKLPTKVINATISTLHKLFKQYPRQKIIAISGNHDYATKNLITKRAVTALDHLAEVFPEKFILIDDTFINDEVFVVGVPYYELKEHYDQALKEVTEKAFEEYHERYSDVAGGAGIPPMILMIHQTPPNRNPMIPYDVDPKDEIYKSFELVLCGHIHGREVITDNFVVVGSPIHRDLSDEGHDKGFLVYDYKKRELDFVHLNEYPVFKRSRNVSPDDEDYTIPIIELEEDETDTFDAENYTTNLSHEDLIKNFWEDKDGKDEELLKIGLSLL